MSTTDPRDEQEKNTPMGRPPGFSRLDLALAYRALIEAFVGMENAVLTDGGGEEDEVYDNS